MRGGEASGTHELVKALFGASIKMYTSGMSAVPRNPGSGSLGGSRMTAEQFLSLGETEARLELVDGVISVSPSPVPSHQRVVHELCFQLERWARASGGATVYPDTDVEFRP